MSKKTVSYDYDCLIIGAGMVGLSAALALERLGLTVAVIDKTAPTEQVDAIPLRVSALSLGSENLLRLLGAWPALKAQHARPYDSMRIWERDGIGMLSFSAREMQLSHLGSILPNKSLQFVLTALLQQRPGATMMMPADCQSLSVSADCVHLEVDGGRCYRSRLLIAADGAESWTRQQLSVGLSQRSYQQKAIVASLCTSQPHGNCARQVYVNGSPLAFLPLLDPHHCSMVWSLPLDESTRLLRLSDQAFCRELALSMTGSLGSVELLTERHAFPLVRREAERYIDERVVLMGDAKQTIHPMAGLGANIGLMDVAVMYNILEQALAKGRDIASPGLLRRYQRQRLFDTRKTIYLMDALDALFRAQQPVVEMLRNRALATLSGFSGVKSQLVAQATGLSGDVPHFVKKHTEMHSQLLE